MGFNTSSTSINLTAKLTPLGRQKLISTNNALITSFSLGDSDANYNTDLNLISGEVPSLGGEIGPNNTISNGVTANAMLKSMLVVNANGITKKPVQGQSVNILSEQVYNGTTTVSGALLTHLVINRTDVNTDPLTNLFASFGLPLNSSDDTVYTGITYASGGYSDTALSGLPTDKIVVIAIDNTQYGELIDGKSVNLYLPTNYGPTYNIYGTYMNKGASLTTEDANMYDTSIVANNINQNIAFLFSDTIQTPNTDPTLSWATGSGLNKPFSVNQKQLFNLQTNSNLNQVSDVPVGIAYLDKGIIVITNPTIVADYYEVLPTGAATGTTVTFNSVSTNVFQNITCIADRGEFGSTTNKTFSDGDTPRFSEVGLYDNMGNLIAIAKSDRQVSKNINEFLVLGIKITI